MTVPATEVLAMIQQTLCLIGSASEHTSQARRAKILEAIDPHGKKFSEESFPSAKGPRSGRTEGQSRRGCSHEQSGGNFKEEVKGSSERGA